MRPEHQLFASWETAIEQHERNWPGLNVRVIVERGMVRVSASLPTHEFDAQGHHKYRTYDQVDSIINIRAARHDRVKYMMGVVVSTLCNSL